MFGFVVLSLRTENGQQIITHSRPILHLTHFCHIIRSTENTQKTWGKKIPLPPSKNHFVEKSPVYRLNASPAFAEVRNNFDRLLSGHLIGRKRRPSSSATKSCNVSWKAKLAFEVFFLGLSKEIVLLDKFLSNVQNRLFAKLAFAAKLL